MSAQYLRIDPFREDLLPVAERLGCGQLAALWDVMRRSKSAGKPAHSKRFASFAAVLLTRLLQFLDQDFGVAAALVVLLAPDGR
jgi:hypothetical protein